MATQRKPAIEKPEKFDLEKGEAIALKIARRNVEWVKEMAKK